MQECNNFWSQLDHSTPIRLQYYSPVPSQTISSKAHHAVSEENKLQIQVCAGLPVELTANKKTADMSLAQPNANAKQYYEEVVNWSERCQAADVELSAGLCGRLYEDVQDRYIWKTKWGLPPTLVKISCAGDSSTVDVQKFLFEMIMVEADTADNCFILVPEGIRGQSRKSATNNFCEFKGLKLACWQEGQKRRLLILVWVPDPKQPLTRTAVGAFLSPQIQMFSENGKVIQVERLDQFRHYFQLFDPDVFQKSVRRSEEDREHFYAYMLKKNPKIKNILYIAFKFPDIVTLYLNRSLLKNAEHNSEQSDQVCNVLFSRQEINENSQLHLVANYINPQARIVLKINCPSDEFKFIINKDFTHILSVLVGDVISIDEAKFVKVSKDIKPMYFQYYRTIVESDDQQESKQPAEADQEEQCSPYKILNGSEERQSKSKGSTSKRQETVRQRERRAKKKKQEDEDSLFVSQDQQEEASDFSESDKKLKKNSYTKWLERSKRETMKRKEELKKANKFTMNGKARMSTLPTVPALPMANGVSSRAPTSFPPSFQQPQISYILMDPRQGFGGGVVPQQTHMISASMAMAARGINTFQGLGGMLQPSMGSKFVIGGPQIINGASPITQAAQRNKEHEQEGRDTKENTVEHKFSSKWMAQPQENIALPQQPQGFLVGNSSFGFNQFGQMGQFSQNPGLIAVSPQTFLPQQGLPPYRNIMVADQLFGQPASFHPSSLQDSPQLASSFNPLSHGNGVKIEKDQSTAPNSSARLSSGVETRNQKNKQDKQRNTNTVPKIQASHRQQQEVRPTYLMQVGGFPQQMATLGMMPQMSIQPMLSQQAGMQYVGGSLPNQAFYAMPQTPPALSAQFLGMRKPAN